MSKKTRKKSEPLIQISKRESISSVNAVVIKLIALVAALTIDAAIVTSITNISFFSVYGVMIKESFGNISRFSWALRDMVLLLGIGIALAPAFKMRFWNIGAEGQVLAGALAASIVMYYCDDSMNNAVVIIVMVIVSILAGAVWGIVPAVFKAKWNTNETLFTLMMNYIAIQLVACMTELWRGRASALGKINSDSFLGWMPQLNIRFLPEIFNQRYTINIIAVTLLTVIMFFYLSKSKHGYEIAVVGESQNTAKYAGINVKKVIIRTMAISGAICGLIGFFTVSGKDQTISTDTAGGNGFTAIIVAWIAKFNTFTMAGIAFLLIFLQRGAAGIASQYGLNSYLADIVSGIVLFFILSCEFFIEYKVNFRKKSKEVK